MAAIRDTLELDIDAALRQVKRLRDQIEQPVDVQVDVDARGFAEVDRQLEDIEQSAHDFTRELDESEKEARDLARSLRKAAGQADDIDDATGRATKGIGGMSNALKGFITIAAVGLVARKIVDFAGATVTAASDMAESVGKAEVVFGEFAEEIFTFTEDAPEALRLSTQAAIEMAGTFGNLFLALGLSQRAAADLAPEIVQLGADLGSFNNIEVGEVLEKLRAGLVGEAEPLRTLGVNLTAATTKAKALELGLADATGELSAAALVQARWALILEQTTTAQGDAARTADLFAGQAATMAAEFDNLKVIVGEELIPVLSEIIPIIIDLIEVIGPGLADAVEDTLLVLGRIAGIFNPAIAAATETAIVFRRVDETMGDGFGNMTKFRTAIEGLARAGVLTNETFEDARRRYEVDLPEAMFGTRIAVDHLTDSFDDAQLAIGDMVGPEEELRTATELLAEKQRDLWTETELLFEAAYEAGTATEVLGAATETLADETGNLVVDTERLVVAQDDLVQSLKDTELAQRNYLTSLIASTDPVFRAVEAWGRYQEAIVAANEDGTVTANEELGILSDRLEAIDAFTTLGDDIEGGLSDIALAADWSRERVEELFRELGLFDGSVFSADILLNVLGSAPQFIPEGMSLVGGGATVGPQEPSGIPEGVNVTIINPTTEDLDTDVSRAAQTIGAVTGLLGVG